MEACKNDFLPVSPGAPSNPRKRVVSSYYTCLQKKQISVPRVVWGLSFSYFSLVLSVSLPGSRWNIQMPVCMCVCIFLGVFVLQIHGHLLHRDIFIYHDVHMRAYGPHEYLWHGVSTQMLIVVVGEALTLSSCWAVNKHTDTCHSFKGIVGRMYTHTCRININIHIYSSRYIDLCIIYI